MTEEEFNLGIQEINNQIADLQKKLVCLKEEYKQSVTQTYSTEKGINPGDKVKVTYVSNRTRLANGDLQIATGTRDFYYDGFDILYCDKLRPVFFKIKKDGSKSAQRDNFLIWREIVNIEKI